MHWIIYVLSLLAAGVFSGFASGLLGVGGGIVRIPVFLFLFPLFGVHSSILMHVSAATSLTLAVPSAIMASLAQFRAGKLDPDFLKSWVPALVIGVFSGLIIVRHVSSGFLEAVFAFVILFIALQMLFTSAEFKLTKEVPGGLIRGVAAAIIGGVSTLIGIAGGSLTTPLLTSFGYPIHRSIAVATASGFFISIIGSAGGVINGLGVPGRPDFSLGYVDLTAVFVMMPAVITAAPLGVKLAVSLSQHRLRRIFAVFLFVVAFDMLYNVFLAHGK